MLATGFHEGFVGALHNSLTADIDPTARGHLAIHRQPFRIQFVKMFPRRPVRHEVRVGNQYARGIFMGFKHPHRFAGLHQQGFVAFKMGQRVHNGVVAFPVARCATDAAVHHQLMRIFSNVGIEIVHQHAQRRFGEPAFGCQRGAAWGADLLLTVFT